jgi:hypothetical protein
MTINAVASRQYKQNNDSNFFFYRFTNLQLYKISKFDDKYKNYCDKEIHRSKNEFNDIDINPAIGKMECVLCMCVDDGVTKLSNEVRRAVQESNYEGANAVHLYDVSATVYGQGRAEQSREIM